MKYFIALAVILLFSFGAKAQDVRFLTVEELQEAFQEKNDTIFVYNFWATWCRPCVAELPHFEALNEDHLKNKVKVILVSLDFPEDFDTKLKPFLERKQLSSEVWALTNAHDSGEWIDQVHPDWSGAIPATLISMPSMGIYAFKEQPFTHEELEEWVLGFEWK